MGVRRIQVSAEFIVHFCQGTEDGVAVKISGNKLPRDAKVLGVRVMPDHVFAVELESAEWSPVDPLLAGSMAPLVEVNPVIERIELPGYKPSTIVEDPE